LVSMAITTSNKEFILDSYDTDGGESSMAHNPHELTPPLPKEGILWWWHKVHGRTRAK
jgi:hypothetical protein